jgi:hypothetical protein
MEAESWLLVYTESGKLVTAFPNDHGADSTTPEHETVIRLWERACPRWPLALCRRLSRLKPLLQVVAVVSQ